MDVIQEVGAYAGFAAVVGLAVLAALFFSQARDLRRLREWAGRAPERAAEQAAAHDAALTPQPVRPAPTGAVRPIPAAKPAPAAAAQTGAKPATATAQPATAAKPATAGGKPATAAATAGAAATQVKPGEAKPGETKPGEAKPDDKEGKKPAEAKPGEEDTGEKPATEVPAPAAAAPAGPAPATAAAAPAAPKPAGPPVPPARPAGIPARPAPVGRTPAPASASQSTAVLPASARVRSLEPGGRRRSGLDARYIALIVAGVVVLGAGAAFGISQLGGDDDAPSTDERADRDSQPAGPLNRSLVTVSVLNGTTVPGLAAQIGDEIESKGFQRGNVANAIDQQRPDSVVMFAEGAERPARIVARGLGISTIEPVDPDSQALAGNASVVVIVGMDQTQ